MTLPTVGGTLSAMKWILWAVLPAALLLTVAQVSAPQDLQNANGSNQKRNALLAKITSTQTLSKRTADAFTAVPRERFLPGYLENMAYDDSSLPLGSGQTLPSPSDLLRAIQALDVASNDRVLVVGANTGYASAILSRLAAKVYDVELVQGDRAGLRQLFSSLGYDNITVSSGSNSDSFAAIAPFDRIFVHGAAAEVPQSVFSQLGNNGKMIVPLRDPTSFQMVVELSRAGGNTSLRALGKGFYSPIQIGVSK